MAGDELDREAASGWPSETKSGHREGVTTVLQRGRGCCEVLRDLKSQGPRRGPPSHEVLMRRWERGVLRVCDLGEGAGVLQRSTRRGSFSAGVLARTRVYTRRLEMAEE